MKDEYLIGRKPILDAINQGKTIEKMWLDVSIKGELEIEIRKLSKAKHIPLVKVPKEKLKRLVNRSNHQGLVAQISPIQYHKISDILPFLFEQGKTPRILILDRVEDVRNFGAIARSAVWFDFQAIIIPQKESARVNAISMKTSAGALTNIHVCRESSLVNCIEYLIDSGITCYAADMNGESSTPNASEQPLALIVGSEEKGISPALMKKAQTILSIPGTGKVESLNVSVAAAILMYQLSLS